MLRFITILSSSLYKAKNPHLKNVVHIKYKFSNKKVKLNIQQKRNDVNHFLITKSFSTLLLVSLIISLKSLRYLSAISGCTTSLTKPYIGFSNTS